MRRSLLNVEAVTGFASHLPRVGQVAKGLGEAL